MSNLEDLEINVRSKLKWIPYKYAYGFNVPGSVHDSIIHKENPTRCNSVSKFYFLFI
jgi:hypothetical protein